MTTKTTVSLSNMKALIIPGPSYSGPRSALVEYSHSLSTADRDVFKDYLSSKNSSALHKFTAHFPLDAFGGAKDITIIVREQLSAVKGAIASTREDSVSLAGCYDLINLGEDNPLLVRATNAFTQVVFNSKNRSIQLELPDHHIQTWWTLTEEPENPALDKDS